MGEGFGSIIAGVRNLLPVRHELPITHVVDSIMEGSSQGSGVEDYLTFDPKTSRGSSQTISTPTKKTTFAEAVVFVVGGGNYHEYHNLTEYASRSNLVKKTVIYGSTELISSTNFIKELEALGNPAENFK